MATWCGLRRATPRIEAPVLIRPGRRTGIGAATLGYGRTRAGRIGNGIGFDVYPLRTSERRLGSSRTSRSAAPDGTRRFCGPSSNSRSKAKPRDLQPRFEPRANWRKATRS